MEESIPPPFVDIIILLKEVNTRLTEIYDKTK